MSDFKPMPLQEPYGQRIRLVTVLIPRAEVSANQKVDFLMLFSLSTPSRSGA